jgi:hypothetical protein
MFTSISFVRKPVSEFHLTKGKQIPPGLYRGPDLSLNLEFQEPGGSHLWERIHLHHTMWHSSQHSLMKCLVPLKWRCRPFPGSVALKHMHQAWYWVRFFCKDKCQKEPKGTHKKKKWLSFPLSTNDKWTQKVLVVSPLKPWNKIWTQPCILHHKDT